MESEFFDISPEILSLADKALEMTKPVFEEIDSITRHNQLKMLKAFQDARVSESCFAASTGYGYGDRGREALDSIFFLPRYLTPRTHLCATILQAALIR